MIQHNTTQHNTIRYDTIRYDTEQDNTKTNENMKLQYISHMCRGRTMRYAKKGYI